VNSFHALSEYLARATGSSVLLKPAERLEGKLPVYLAKSYALGRGEILGEQMTLALAMPEMEGRPSLKRLQADFKALRLACDASLLVLAFEHLPSHLRSHLVKARIPFVVIGRQIFLPHYWVDLREREEAPPESPPSFLTWSAQVVLLRHLLWHDVEERSLSELADKLHYSAMAMTHARRQLQAAELATTCREGRSKHLSFVQQGRSLWEQALPKLRRPWSRRVALNQAELPKPYQVWSSGISALSRRSLISSEGIPVRAIHGDFLRKAEESQGLSVAEHMEFAQIKLEVWEYDPGLLAKGDSVDSLSLFLCLREDPNERVQGALEDLLDGLSW
jgi:DNA-binding MarR family transcriptional regulator